MKEMVFLKNRQALTTSRTVAEKFGKRHDHVIRDIKEITAQVGDAPKIGDMFHETTYADKYGRQKPMYTMNRDGYKQIYSGTNQSMQNYSRLSFITQRFLLA